MLWVPAVCRSGHINMGHHYHSVVVCAYVLLASLATLPDQVTDIHVCFSHTDDRWNYFGALKCVNAPFAVNFISILISIHFIHSFISPVYISNGSYLLLNDFITQNEQRTTHCMLCWVFQWENRFSHFILHFTFGLHTFKLCAPFKHSKSR